MAEFRELYQFPLSHYCEKVRWLLDAKRLDYRPRNLHYGVHRLRARLRAGVDTLPVLKDGHRHVGDSTRIAYYLERHYPQPPLLPADPDAAQQVIELEQRFDRHGVHVRRWVFGQALGLDSVADGLLDDYQWSGWARSLWRPLVEQGIRWRYRLQDDAVEHSLSRLEEGLALIEQRTGGRPGAYLVGDRLTLADITAASLYGPLVAPPGTPWAPLALAADLPAALAERMAQVRARPAGQWVLARYAQDRFR